MQRVCRFLSHEFLTPLHDSHPDNHDAEGAEEQHDIAGNGNPMQVYGRYVLRDEKGVPNQNDIRCKAGHTVHG